MDVKGKVALIAGGARIGRHVADALARRGCHLAVTYRSSRKSAELTAEHAAASGVKCALIPADLEDPKSLDAVAPAVEKELGRLDILVHMASVYEKTPLAELQAAPGGTWAGYELWRRNMDVDLRSAYALALQAAPLMKRQGGGRVVAVSDWIAASGRPRYKSYLPYYVAKVGVRGLVEALALELAPEVLVNAVAPGPILPPPDLAAEEYEESMRQTPLKKWGGPEEIVKAVLFLLETDFVTGECLRVDGGRHLY